MEYNVFRKVLVYVVIVLFVGTGVVPTISGDDGELTGVEDAYVFLDWTDGVYEYSNGTITNSAGYYEMNVAEGEVSVSAMVMLLEGNKMMYVMNHTGTFDVSGSSCMSWKNITLQNFPNDTACIKGHVYDNESMAPIQADISIYFSEDYCFGVNTTTSDEDGYYELNIPPLNVTIIVSADGYYTSFNYAELGAGETETFDFYLNPEPSLPPPTAILKGYVKDVDTSNAIDDAQVTVYDVDYYTYDNSTYTDSEGYYEFDIPKGNFSIYVSDDDYFDNSTMVQVNESETKWANMSLIPFPEDNAWVEGYIRDNKTGLPIQNAEVDVYGSITINAFMIEGFERNGATNETGYYNVSVPAVDTEGTVYYYINYSEINSIDAQEDGYFDNSTSFDFPSGLIEPGQTKQADILLDPMPEENCMVRGYIFMKWTPQSNSPPSVYNENPGNGAIDVERSPDELSATVEDINGDPMDVYIRWKNHTGEWVTLETYMGVGDGTYNFIPSGNDWIWGNTTYTWSVNVTDGTFWTNETYHYTTGGSRYDVSNNDVVNFQDAGLVWIHRTSEVDYDGIYDVNQNGVVNFQDAGLTWVNRD